MKSKWLLICLTVLFFALAMQDPAENNCLPPKLTAESREKELTVDNICVKNYHNCGTVPQHFTTVPQRLLVVGSSEIETVIALGQTHRIAATKSWYDLYDFLPPRYYKEIKKVPFITSGNYSLEYVHMLEPDLIVAQQGAFTNTNLVSTAYWNRKNIPTLVPHNTNDPYGHDFPETIEAEMEFIKTLGKVLNEEDRATKIISSTYDTLHTIQKESASLPKPTVMVIEFFGKSVIASYDKTKLAGNMVSRLGGLIPVTDATIDLETLIMLNPDVIFIVCYDWQHYEEVTAFMNTRALNSLMAVRTKRVYPIWLEHIYSPETKTEEGLKVLARGMYPSLPVT